MNDLIWTYNSWEVFFKGTVVMVTQCYSPVLRPLPWAPGSIDLLSLDHTSELEELSAKGGTMGVVGELCRPRGREGVQARAQNRRGSLNDLLFKHS